MDNNKKELEFLGEVVREEDIHEMLRQAMRDQGHKSYIDLDGVEKTL